MCWSADIRFLAVLTALAISGCGPVPQPFRQTAPTPLAENRAALLPILVKPVEGQPGLAEAVAGALLKEELAASTATTGNAVLVLEGRVEQPTLLRRLGWRVVSPTGEDLGHFQLPLPAGSETPAVTGQLGRSVASVVAGLLRGDDSGVADLEARPRVLLAPIRGSGRFDTPALVRAMRDALANQGLRLVESEPRFRIEGELRVLENEAAK
ncbi:MAG TPA: hypothetical protein HPQ04_11460, partial [Rhodospirillaceae bacterium]|nr:hypothetical protein [Rhodospirillaceae bacterium]